MQIKGQVSIIFIFFKKKPLFYVFLSLEWVDTLRYILYSLDAKGLQMYVSRGVLKRERMLELN